MNLERIRARLAEMAASPKNVDFDDLVNLLDKHIGPMYKNYNHHGSPHHAFTVGTETFNIAKPTRGNVKQVYVKNFLEKMANLGLHQEGGEDGDD